MDIVVHVGCGERGNEMDVLNEFPELIDPASGGPSRNDHLTPIPNMPVAAREASFIQDYHYEYFRDGHLAATWRSPPPLG